MVRRGTGIYFGPKIHCSSPVADFHPKSMKFINSETVIPRMLKFGGYIDTDVQRLKNTLWFRNL